MTSALRKPLLPSGTPGWITPELLADTQALWQSVKNEALTPETALEILLHVGGLMDLLWENST